MIMMPASILAIENDDDRYFMECLFQDYNRLMYKYIIEIVHDQWSADDVLQNVVLKLIDKVSELREKDRDHLVNYLISASKNRARNYVRDKGRRPEFTFEDYLDMEDVANSRHAMELELIKEEELEWLAKAWPNLDERTQHLLEGRYMLNKSDAELSEELGMKPDSVRVALSRARKTAKKVLEKTMEAGRKR